MLTGSTILITGGTGSFGHTFVPMTLAKYNPKKLIIYSRDEMKQWNMAKLYKDDPQLGQRCSAHQGRSACAGGLLLHVGQQQVLDDDSRAAEMD